MPVDPSKKIYLGDSVYAQFDGWYVTLTTDNGTGRPSNTIHLEPPVLRALGLYVKELGIFPKTEVEV